MLMKRNKILTEDLRIERNKNKKARRKANRVAKVSRRKNR